LILIEAAFTQPAQGIHSCWSLSVH